MTYWNILEIPANTDVAGIKLAYAAKVKSTRPDTHPEQFKQLHNAYKQALAVAKQQKAVSVSDTNNAGHTALHQHESTNNDNYSVVQKVEVEAQNFADSATAERMKQADELSDIKRQYAMLQRQASEVISESERRNKVSEWEFLTESPAILEPWIHSELGIYIFNEIYRINSDARNAISNRRHSKRKRYLAPNAEVRKSIVAYLNDIFHWTAQQEQLRFYIDADAYKFVFSLLPDVNSNAEQQKAVQAVKGSRIVLGQQAHRETALEKHNNRQQALAKVKSMTVNTLVIIMVILFISMLSMFAKDKLIDASIILVCLVIAGIFAIFVWKENKYAFNLIWLYAAVLLFCFPIGTYIGSILVHNLLISTNQQS